MLCKIFTLLTLVLGIPAASAAAEVIVEELHGTGEPYTLHLTITMEYYQPGTVQGTLHSSLDNETYTVRGNLNRGKIKASVLLNGEEVGTLDSYPGETSRHEVLFRFRGVRILCTYRATRIAGEWLESNKSTGRQRQVDIQEVGDRVLAHIGGFSYQGANKATTWTFSRAIDSPDDFDYFNHTGDRPPAPVVNELCSKGIVVTYTMTLVRASEMQGQVTAYSYSWRGEQLVDWSYAERPVVWTRKIRP